MSGFNAMRPGPRVRPQPWEERFDPEDFTDGDAIPAALRRGAEALSQGEADRGPGDASPAPATALDPPRPLGRVGFVELLTHPLRAFRDRDVRACVCSGSFFDEDAAAMLGGLPKAEQREMAGWFINEDRHGRHNYQSFIRQLSQIPRPLRRGAWELAHHMSHRSSDANERWLRQICSLPPADLRAWIGWLPSLGVPESRRHTVMEWLALPWHRNFTAIAQLALAYPEAMEDLVELQKSMGFGAMRENVGRSVSARLEAQPFEATFAAVMADLDAVQPNCFGLDDTLADYILRNGEGDEETRAALRALASAISIYEPSCMGYALGVPVRFRAYVARMLTRIDRTLCQSLRFADLDNAGRSVILLAAAGQAKAADCQAQLMLWNALYGAGQPHQAYLQELSGWVQKLHDAGTDPATVARLLQASWSQSHSDVQRWVQGVQVLAHHPGWTWRSAAEQLIELTPDLAQVLLQRAEHGPLPQHTAARLLHLPEYAWELARQYPDSLDDDDWVDILVGLNVQRVTQLRDAGDAGDAETQLEAAVAGTSWLRKSGVCERLRALRTPDMGVPHLCVLAHALAIHAGVIKLLPHFAALPEGLRHSAVIRLASLPERERQAWATYLPNSPAPEALLRALAAQRTAEARRALRLADEGLGGVTQEALDATLRLVANTPEATQAADFAALAQCALQLDLRGANATPLVTACAAHSGHARKLLLAALGGLGPCLRQQPLEQRRALLRQARDRAVPTTQADYDLLWADARDQVAALGQAMLWLAAPAPAEALPVVDATEPWERARQTALRTEKLAQCAPPSFEDHPAAWQAASQRGAHALALLLAGHANAPPHVLYALHQAQGDVQAAQELFTEEGDAMRAAAFHWNAVGPLPRLVAAALPPLQIDSGALQAPALQQLFAYCDALMLPPRLALPLRIAALERVQASARAQPEQGDFTCVVCDEATSVHTRLGGCTCEPALCDGCATEAVTRVGDRLTCPTACPAPLNRAYLERLGIDHDVAEQRLVALHRDLLRRVPEWALDNEGLGGRHVPPPPTDPDSIPPIRPGQARTPLRLLLSGLAAWPNANGDGVHRECYVCAAPVQKGDACLHMTCRGAEPHEWDFERGCYDNRARYATNGLQAQDYIPLARGPLAAAGFYDGLPAGVFDEATRRRVGKRRDAWLGQLGGPVTPREEREILRFNALPAGGDFQDAGEVP